LFGSRISVALHFIVRGFAAARPSLAASGIKIAVFNYPIKLPDGL
jgi:hypothetical protein